VASFADERREGKAFRIGNASNKRTRLGVVLLSSEDIRADQVEAYSYINRALPDAELDGS
jgi:hypothetical protein